MKPVAVLYASREGQTQRVAEYLAATLRPRGHAAEVIDVTTLAEPIALADYAAAVLAASVHLGRHEPEMVTFVKRHRIELESLPTAFVSVSFTEAAAESAPSAEARAQAASSVQEMLDEFFKVTGWHPKHVKPVAGALLYTRYGLIKRLAIRMLAERGGARTDASRDYEYTDWEALDRFVDELLPEVRER